MGSYLYCLLPLLLVASLEVRADQDPLGETGDPVDLEYQAQLSAWQEAFAATDLDANYWEYAVIRLNNLQGLENADWFSGADAKVDVQALTSSEPEFVFWNDEKLSGFSWAVQPATDEPEWPILGVLAYKRGSASLLQVVVQDDEAMGDDQVLLNTALELPAAYDQWVDFALTSEGYTLNLSVYRSVTPLFSSQDQANMGLTEVLFFNEDQSVASLVHKTKAGNTKAVLHFPGRADSFAYPHVLAMYEEMGYDFYSIDPRYCGRARRFMADTQYGHWIEDFDAYQEEIDATLGFINQQADYTSVVAYAHSTGALMALNYALQRKEAGQPEPFDGYILNGPFLDWGHVGGFHNELLLENAGLIEWILPNPRQAAGLSMFHARMWVLYRFNTEWRPVVQTHLNSRWAQAATRVQRTIARQSRNDPITAKKVLLLSSKGDNTLLHTESEERMPHVASDYTVALMDHNSHDVTFSFTKELNDKALAIMSEWLVNPPEKAPAEDSWLESLGKWIGSIFGGGGGE